MDPNEREIAVMKVGKVSLRLIIVFKPIYILIRAVTIDEPYCTRRKVHGFETQWYFWRHNLYTFPIIILLVLIKLIFEPNRT